MVDATLVVYGDRSGPVVLADPVARVRYEPKGYKVRLVHPSVQQVREQMLTVDAFWFWGHGNHGGLWLGNGEFLGLDSVREMAHERASMGLPQLQRATLRACHSLCSPEAEDAWLELAEVVEGFRGVTMERWGRVNPILEVWRP